jgi:hypothetical protein
MIKDIKHIPVTKESYPFAMAAEKCEFDKIGYIEDEYFMSGTANVYDEDGDNKPVPIYMDAPYTTRLLIRRPANIKRFSGNVVIEILNASAMIDIDRMWVNSWKFFTRNGDIFIGITSKGHVVDSLKRFDIERYRDISWDNPMPERPAPQNARGGPFGFLPQFESGLFWDMVVDLAKLLRTDSKLNPIAEYGKSYLFLTGWSQSGGYIARILNSFAYLPDNCKGGPLFDGYLTAGSGNSEAPMNAYSRMRPFGRGGIPNSSVMGGKEPVIAVNTESENRFAFWYGDFDHPEFKFRTWQIPASSHDTRYNLIEYYEGRGEEDLKRIEISNGWEGCEGLPIDCPYEPIFNAAFHHLYNWARYGIPAPRAPKIETEIVIDLEESTDPFGSFVVNRTDVFGNALGGIRHPAADCPTGTYYSSSRRADGTVQAMFGHVIVFSPEKLKAIYGDIDNYRALVTKSTDDAISKGFILPEDRDELIERVVATAVERGL